MIPARLLSWANSALIERAGLTGDFVTAACVTYLPSERILRWAYAGHPPALRLADGRELAAGKELHSAFSRIPAALSARAGYARRGRTALHRRADRSAARGSAFSGPTP